MSQDENNHKLPVVDTFKETYANWFASVKHWPRLLVVPVTLIVLSQLIMPAHNPANPMGMAFFGFTAMTLSLLANLIMTVNVLKFMLGNKMPSDPLWQLDLSNDVWRLLGWMIMFILIMMGVALVIIAAGFLLGLGNIATAGLTGAHPAVLSIFILLAIIVSGFILMRLGLLAPCVVMEKDVNPLKLSWHITKGNVWRIIGASLLIALPLIVSMIVIGAILGVGVGMMMHAQGAASVATVSPIVAIVMALLTLLLQMISVSAVAVIFKKLK